MSKKRKQAPNQNELKELYNEALGHYRNFIDSDDAESEADSLHEIISLLGPYFPSEEKDIKELGTTTSEYVRDTFSAKLTSFVSILLSISCFHLGSLDVSASLENESGSEDGGDPSKYLRDSLKYFEYNPATLSMLANYSRMNNLETFEMITHLYDLAASNARCVRLGALEILDMEDGTVEEDVKENVELLLLNGCAGVEYFGDEEEDSLEENEKDCEEEEEESGYSFSEVEATSRFMAAFLNSVMNKHDKALEHLHKFGMTHRIHPKVWNTTITQEDTKYLSDSETNMGGPSIPRHLVNPAKNQGILPDHLYQELLDVFRPNAPYWKESGYHHRGYYSYYHPLPKNHDSPQYSPKNIMEEVLFHHLLPLLPDKENICGAEWWVHTRPTGANLGHQLHFDTDEAMLQKQKVIRHPIFSSVLYLTGGGNENSGTGSGGGPTLVFNQTPAQETVADKVWKIHPKDNSFMVFPGELLHGVLPCPGTDGNDDKKKPLNRLTLMVGFWTSSKEKDENSEDPSNKEFYSPRSPLPPATSDHTWVQQLSKGYPKKPIHSASNNAKCLNLHPISPAWECIAEESDATLNEAQVKEPLLETPMGVDHRFFVSDAPRCFYDALFKDDDLSEC